MEMQLELIRNGKVISQSVPGTALSVSPATVKNGDTLRVNVSFKYSGPAQDRTLYGAVGIDPNGANIGLYSGTASIYDFDEALVGEHEISLPAKSESDNYTFTGYVDIPIVVSWDATASFWSNLFMGFDGALPPADSYDLYVKIKENASVSVKAMGAVNLSSEGASGTQSTLSSIGTLLQGMILIMIMSMMMEAMPDIERAVTPTQENPKPITKLVTTGVQKGVEVGKKVVKKVTEYYEEQEEQ